MKHFHILHSQNNSNQNGVNIQDVDFTIFYPTEPCIIAIFKSTIFKFWVVTENYIRIHETFEFGDSLSTSSEIKLVLEPSQIKFFFFFFHRFLRIFRISLSLELILLKN
jgi:hypothetical protein